jgi:hypothetical protein
VTKPHQTNVALPVPSPDPAETLIKDDGKASGGSEKHRHATRANGEYVAEEHDVRVEEEDGEGGGVREVNSVGGAEGPGEKVLDELKTADVAVEMEKEYQRS